MNISFNKETHLSQFSSIPADVGQIYTISYFAKKNAVLKFLSTNSPDLEQSLIELCDGSPISADFEWQPEIDGSFHPISIFQFASSKGVLVIENDDIFITEKEDSINPPSLEILRNFLINNKFFGKGTTTDKLKLHQMFHQDIDIEDVEETYLKPNNLPLGFLTLVSKLIGRPAARFKDPNVSRSNWSQRPLSIQQLLYAGFDAYAMLLCYNKMTTISVDELISLFPKPDVVYTKKHKLKSEIVVEHPIKLKTKFNLSFADLTLNPLYLRNQEIEAMHFIPHEEYNTRYSLFYMYFAENLVVKNNEQYECKPCNLTFQTKEEVMDHLWSQHTDSIPKIYFLFQSPSYIIGCIKQIDLANDCLILDGNQVKCKICGRSFTKFRGLYTHCRMFHAGVEPETKAVNIKHILFDNLSKTGKIDKEKRICHVCEQYLSAENSQTPSTSVKILSPAVSFDSEDQFLEHCWMNHSGVFISLWKHRPSPYTRDLYNQCFDFGKLAIENLPSATMFNGVYACNYCLVGFDSPGELFIHLFHRHTVVQTVKACDVVKWPFQLKDLPKDMVELIRKISFVDAVQSLEKEGILQIDRTSLPEIVDNSAACKNKSDSDDEEIQSETPKEKKSKQQGTEKMQKPNNPLLDCPMHCNECKQSLETLEKKWNHILERHLILNFSSVRYRCHDDLPFLD